MKKILLIVLFTLTLFGNNNACKLDVYFGNGVDNDSAAAEKSMKKLRIFMQDHSPQKFTIENEGVTYNFKYAHNETYGVINDLIETFWQLYDSGQISKMYFSFVAGALNGLDNTNPANSAYIQRLQNIINQYNLNTGVMLNQYRDNSFSKNHNVLLVAHSQGNLFGNKMYELFSSDEKKRFAMVSVATPADHVAKGGGYTTLDNDPVIMLILDSLPSNASGFGHSFVESYLNNPTYKSVEAIANNINAAVDLLDKNSCSTYKYFRWIAYMCPSRSDTELEVGIYGSRVNSSGAWLKEELVANDSKIRIPFGSNGQCPLQGWDYRTDVSAYDKNGCNAYTFDDTSGGYHTLEYIASQTYDNGYTCTKYKMSLNITEKLRALQK
ncbi:hypothetical protein [Sulfurimonas sp.]